VGDEVEPVGTEASADNSSFYGDEYDAVLSLLVNIAVDGNLAVSIFDTISNTAAGPLERLSLRVNVLTHYLPRYLALNADFKRLTEWVGRSWVCRRYDAGSSGGDEVVVEEKVGKKREALRERLNLAASGCEDQWNELWSPWRTGDWRDDWRSLPLSRHGW